MVEFSVLGAKVEFLRGKSLSSAPEGSIGEVVVGSVLAAVAVVVAVVVVAAVVVAAVVVAAVVVAAAAVVVVEGFDVTLVGTVVGLVVEAVIVVKLFVGIEELAAGIVAFVLDSKVLDWPPKVVAFDTVLLIDSTGGVKASGGTVDTSRSTCCSVIDDIVVNMGSMTGRIVVFKSMC